MIEKISLKTTLIISTLLLIIFAFWSGWLNENKLSAWFYFARFQFDPNESVKCSSLLRIFSFTQQANLNLDSLIERTYPGRRFDLWRSVAIPLPGEYAVAELGESLEWAKRKKASDSSWVYVLLLKKKLNGEYDIIHTCPKPMA